MITIPEVVENIVRKSLFLEEALSLGIVNISALARLIKRDVEKEVMKKVQEGAVVMALNRFQKKIKKKVEIQKKIFRNTPDLMVRSNLIEITYSNSELLVHKQKILLDQLSGRQYFITFTQGINETTIIASKELEKKILKVFEEENVISRIDKLSSITVLLPEGTALVPGAYNYILKSLAWEGINIIEVVSTFNELTIILEDKHIDFSFSIIKRLF